MSQNKGTMRPGPSKKSSPIDLPKVRKPKLSAKEKQLRYKKMMEKRKVLMRHYSLRQPEHWTPTLREIAASLQDVAEQLQDIDLTFRSATMEEISLPTGRRQKRELASRLKQQQVEAGTSGAEDRKVKTKGDAGPSGILKKPVTGRKMIQRRFLKI